MKRKNYIFALLALVLLPVSCSRMDTNQTPSDTEVTDPVSVEEQEIKELQLVQGKSIAPITLRASFSKESRSYLEMNGDGTEAGVFWAAGDSFKMLGYDAAEETFHTADFATAEGGEVAAFTTSQSVPSPCYSVYPAIRHQGTLPDGTPVFGVNLPSVQTAVEGNVAPGINLSYAYSESQEAPLNFENLVSLVRFRLSGSIVSEITSVTLSGSSPLSGDLVLVTGAEGAYLAPEMHFDGDEKSSAVSLNGAFVVGKDYYIAVAPAASQLLTLTFANDNGLKKTSFAFNEITLARGNISDFGTIDLGDSFDESVPAVDLGLSVKWAACNLGAQRPEEYGYYYAWGETKQKEDFSWGTYKFGTDSEGPFSKYVTIPGYGSIDHKILLDPEDDVAADSLGGSWRMPTLSECEELLNNCTWTWTSLNGVEGYKVTGNGKWIFLPAAGYREASTLRNAGSYGYYWSSSQVPDIPANAFSVYFASGNVNYGFRSRFLGQSVRPVLSNPESVSWVKLDKTALTLYERASILLSATVLPETATNKQLTWSSSKPEVASVDANGNVQALTAGEAIITVTTSDGGRTAGCTVTVNAYEPETSELVDLGLSVKWATFNLGATKPEEYGDYFAWGETVPKEDYRWSTYKWCMGSENTMTKYCNKSNYGHNGFTDNKTILDPEDDAAAVALGGSWRMATYDEWDELKTKCTWTWTTQNGVNGYKVTSTKTGYTEKWIFLPAAGFRGGSSLGSAGSYGFYWSSSLYAGSPDYACYVYFNSDYVGWHYYTRDYGQSVRPVQAAIRTTGVSLNKTETLIYVGGEESLIATVTPSDAENKDLSWTSSNTAVATVSSDGVVSALSIGEAVITVTTVDGGFTASCTVEVKSYAPQTPELVDLGLSVKWATFNLGATAPEEYGDYFAYGEVEPKSEYTPATYKWCMDGNLGQLTKYCTDSDYGYNGFTDNKTVLDPEDDAATVNLGDDWRMPTEDEFQELLDECTMEYTTLNDVNGIKFTSNKEGYTNKWIFLPAAGTFGDVGLISPGGEGVYWSSSLTTYYPINARFVYFDMMSAHYFASNTRADGRSVRPVQAAIRTTGVSLNKTNIKVLVGDVEGLAATVTPSDADNKDVVWTSSDEGIATVYEDGVVAGVGVGTAEITATTVDGGFTAKCLVTVTAYPIPETVDLGLSVKWGSFNLGATKPEEYGDYFAYGEVEPKSEYPPATYKWCMDGNLGQLTKYCTDSDYGYNGFTDNKTVLDPEDDAAAVALGGSWRMPTKAEQDELRSQCTWTWTSLNGVNGYKVTSTKTGYTEKWIFLPAAGYRDGTGLYGSGSNGSCWSSSLYTGSPNLAYYVGFHSDNVGWGSNYRCYGLSVRPVSE